MYLIKCILRFYIKKERFIVKMNYNAKYCKKISINTYYTNLWPIRK